MKKAFFNSVIILVFFIASTPSVAQRDQIFVGTRPLSMGEAFVAVADDGNAISWNPAGLARMERIQASFNYADLFGLGINSYYASFLSRLYFIPALTDYLSFGVDWFAIQLGDDDELSFDRNQLNFSLAFKPPESWPIIGDFSFGANLKYLNMQARLKDISASDAETDADGFGWDVGILYPLGNLRYLPKGLDFGLMVHDIAGTNLTHQTGVKEEVLGQNIRWGFSYRPFSDWPGGNFPLSDPLLAVDFDDRVHIGLEFWLRHILAVRAGFQKDLHTGESPTISFGLGFRVNSREIPELLADYAFTAPPDLPNTGKQFGVSLIIKENPRLVRIQSINNEDVYASLYLHYGQKNSKIGSMKLKNISQDTLTAWISFDENEYLIPWTQDTLQIAPGEPLPVDLRPKFKQSLLDAGRRHISAKVKVNYEYNDNTYAAETVLAIEVYDKNFLTWDDPKKAAAFVTINDEIVRSFKVAALLQEPVSLQDSLWFFNYHMASALLIYQSLQSFGVRYRIDEKYPFESRHEFLLDKILYPWQILSQDSVANRFGDCDDLTVLYTALLQNAGISTAIVSQRQPGHLFMMFDTGIAESERRSLPISPDWFVLHNHSLWIPVDIALIDKEGFLGAWESGIYRFSKENIETYFEVTDAQQKYPPPTFEHPPGWESVLSLDSAKLQAELAQIKALTDTYLAKYADSLTYDLSLSDRLRIRNHYGALLGQNNEFERARDQFMVVLAEDSTYGAAWNNLGNTEFILGNFAGADLAYQNALAYALSGHGVYLNQAILYQMMIEGASLQQAVYYQHKSEEALKNAAVLFSANQEMAFSYLGYPEEQVEGKAEGLIDSIKRGIRKIKKYIDDGFKKIVKKDSEEVVLDRQGAKGAGEVDENRWALLWWSY